MTRWLSYGPIIGLTVVFRFIKGVTVIFGFIIKRPERIVHVGCKAMIWGRMCVSFMVMRPRSSMFNRVLTQLFRKCVNVPESDRIGR